MKPADLHAAKGAIKRSAAVRARLRGQSPADRDDLLRGCLGDLSAAAAPINVALRSGPLTGRTLRNPEARAVSAALQAERAKVRGMLRRASGGSKARTPYQRAQFKGYVRWVAGRARELESELTHALPQRRKGTPEYRERAEELLGQIDRLQRQRVARHLSADHWALSGAWGKVTKADRALFERSESVGRDLTKLRGRARRAVAVPRDIGFVKPTKPRATPTKRRRWTPDEALDALRAFSVEARRPVRASDLPGNPALPSYGKVHDLFGGLTPELLADLAEEVRYAALTRS